MGLIQTPCRYQLAVTQRKEGEPSSTSIYNLNDPWSPTLDFSDFINNETIAGQVSQVGSCGGERGGRGSQHEPPLSLPSRILQGSLGLTKEESVMISHFSWLMSSVLPCEASVGGRGVLSST